MVILMLHNRYREAGGEERAVAEQVRLLREHNHRVELIEPSSAELDGLGGRLRAGRAMLRGGTCERAVARAVSRYRVDVVHAHNLQPLLGARALLAARAAGARTVLQLHNFRLFCAIGVAYREGEVCHRCRGRDTRAGVRLRCRGGVAESAVYAVGLTRQLPWVLRASDRFIILSEATRAQLGRLGLPLERTDVVANALRAEDFSSSSDAAGGRYALCVGRLVPEKGFDVAIAAARAAGVPLRIVGSGPDEGRLRELAAGGDVELLGRIEGPELAQLRRLAAVQLAPSRCEEQSPYAVLEAMAAGVPVLVSELGGLPELAGPDASLPPRRPRVWELALSALWNDPGERERRGEAARERALARASPAQAYGALLGVYERAGARRS
jgi:glycosyltransferase involved in cell wall biosynthesis